MKRAGCSVYGLLFTSAYFAAALPAPSQQLSPDAPPRRFEVASVKSSKPGADMHDMRIASSRGRYEAINITVNEILVSLTGSQAKIEGGPKWTDSERYDIIAKIDGEATPGERIRMVLALLKERFKLAIHSEPREESGLALTKGKLHLNLKPATDGEQSAIRVARVDDRRRVIFTKVNMLKLSTYLYSMWGTVVVDQTGITGDFDFSLDPDNFADGSGEAFRDRLRPALQEIGIRLEPVKVTRDIIIIDHVERPSEN